MNINVETRLYISKFKNILPLLKPKIGVNEEKKIIRNKLLN